MNDLPVLLQPSSRLIWAQAMGRSLYQAGYGIIQFYIPILFVNQIGLSATAVGVGLGSGSLAGVAGHLLGGYLADSPLYGRKRTLLFAGGLAILAALLLVQTQNLPMLVLANVLLGVSAGCYWTAADAAIVDSTPSEHRHQAFAILVLADSLGNGTGILGGGVLLAIAPRSELLFLSTALIFLLFLTLMQIAIADTRQDVVAQTEPLRGFISALKDRALQLFVLANVLFTTYIALVSSILPLYFTNEISPRILETSGAAGPSWASVANLFTWCYIGIGALLQVPITQALNAVPRVRVLMIAMGLWGAGFLLVWMTGMLSSMHLVAEMAAFGVLSIATAVYKPFAPTIIAEFAPASLRATYLAISYQCWSIGYFVGPIVGGWALDQPPPIAHYGWIAVAITSLLGLLILHVLGQQSISIDVPTPEEPDAPVIQPP